MGEYLPNEEPHPNTLFLDNHSHHTPFHDHNFWHHFPKVDMKKFDGSNLVSWVTQMKHYLSLHRTIYDLMKLIGGFIVRSRTLEMMAMA
jgi:hypothetical protein